MLVLESIASTTPNCLDVLSLTGVTVSPLTSSPFSKTRTAPVFSFMPLGRVRTYERPGKLESDASVTRAWSPAAPYAAYAGVRAASPTKTNSSRRRVIEVPPLSLSVLQHPDRALQIARSAY